MNHRPEPSAFKDQRAVAEWAPPSRVGAMVFAGKVNLFRARRLVTDLVSDARRLARAPAAGFPVLMAEVTSPLWSDERLSERAHQLGKVENLRRAARSLDGAVLGPNKTFSFWKQVGRASRARGYVTGRMLRGGCLVPAIGGGLCQISNGLYSLALDSGCEIVERHAHSRQVPGSASTAGRDATVAWNYVDLRFRSRRPLRIEARLSADTLVMRVWGRAGAVVGDAPAAVADVVVTAPSGPVPRSCSSCQEIACFRHEAKLAMVSAGRRVWLVDDNPPELRRWASETVGAEDVLGLPLDGARWKLDRYRWETAGFRRAADAAPAALIRAAQVRRLASRGPERRAAEIAGAEAIAKSLSRLLTHDVTDVVVAQSLLPSLWRDGWLGGRRFTVLMTRPPMGHLQGVLDAAFVRDMARASLADFRAPAALIEAEAAGLAAADRLVTAHAEVARLFPDKTLLLDWAMPTVSQAAPSAADCRTIAFPGPTAARKGAWAVRDAARALDLEVLLLGSELEGGGFWSGVRTRRPVPGEAWWTNVAAVVQPAVTEESPRRLLAALAAGRPVIASAACGLSPREGLTLIAADDGAALTQALRGIL
ncbi:MAG: hypothetical protein JWP35_2567 [Caulobacter sp.]|nr:hypothetical protein [Caulobacter sp.]